MLSQLRLAPGRKGLRKALGDVPSWVAFQDREKVEVRSHPLCLQSSCQTSHTYLWSRAVCQQDRAAAMSPTDSLGWHPPCSSDAHL